MDHPGVFMARTLKVAPHLTHAELLKRFLSCRDGAATLRWQAILLKQEGRSTVDIADVCKRRVDWVRRTVRRYNANGPEAVPDHRGGSNHNAVLDQEGRDALRDALQNEDPPGGGLWSGPKVARWIGERIGSEVTAQTGLNYLKALGFTFQRPRPRHPEADADAQAAFKKGGSKATFTW